MKIIIDHKKTKREIIGSFQFCCDREDLQILRSLIDEQLLNPDFIYGWIYVDELIETSIPNTYDIIQRQKHITDTYPRNWDS